MTVVVVDTEIVVVEQDRPVNITVSETPNTVSVTDMSIGETVRSDNLVDVVEEADSVVVQGVGIQGPPGADGPQGPPGIGVDSRYIHTQILPNTIWTVNHNLNRDVAVIRLQDSAGTVYEDPAYSIVDSNNLIINLYYPIGGKAVIL
jgi:hypothetical protein